MRIRDSSVPKRNFASVLARRVFPTPVGPRKMKDPWGRLKEETPARERRTAEEISETASFWPTTVLCSSSSMFRSRSVSAVSSCSIGMPVITEITSHTSFTVTVFFSVTTKGLSILPSSSTFILRIRTWSLTSAARS